MKGISVVICTYNGEKTLGEAVKHIATQQSNGFEIELIIVDNNSDYDALKFAEKKWTEFGSPFPLNLLKEPKAGKFNASVKGFNAAKYDFILVCDDDNMLASDYCLKAFNILGQNKNVGIVGGMGIPEFETNAPEWFNNYENLFACGHQYSASGVIDDKTINIWGAGMVFRKSIWNTVRDFKHEFFLNAVRKASINTGGDDTELSELAKWLGYSLYYDETMTFKHFMPGSRMCFNYLKTRHLGLGKSRLYLRAYQYCHNYDEMPDKYLTIPFWKDKLTYRRRELRKYYPKILFTKEIHSNFNYILPYFSLKGEIAEIKRLRDNYIKIYEKLFALKKKIQLHK